MSRFRVGSVPYVNATPLVWWFNHLGEQSPVDVIYAVPSRLPELHRSGEVDAILVSSIDCLRTPGCSVAAGAAIASDGPVESVRMFSRRPWSEIETLALDQSSMTSNALAQIILREKFDVVPELKIHEPNAERMLEVCDACVIIGDKGLEANPAQTEVMDLGSAWQGLTQLPFVWALWTSHRPLDPALVGYLQESAAQGTPRSGNWDGVLDLAASRSGWSRDLIDRYLTHCVLHEFGEAEERGLAMFGKKLMEAGLIDQAHFPEVVESIAVDPAPRR